MNVRLTAATLAAAAALPASAGSFGNAITYQGQLQTAGSNVDGPVDLQFRLFDAHEHLQ